MADRPRPTLLIMAAGIGSRFGGPKQIAPVGPSGEIIIDYSIHDALRAGFGRVVLIVRREIERDVKEVLDHRYAGRLELEYAFQELDTALPAWFPLPAGRRKPWGTGHAILAANGLIGEPFGVINADDFYGADAFEKMARYLSGLPCSLSTDFSMVGYTLANTLSEHGTVSRGVCACNGQGFLQSIVERLAIGRDDAGFFYTEGGARHPLQGDEIASMNFWGFTPAVFPQLRAAFEGFLRAPGAAERAEFLIPTAIGDLIRQNLARVKVLPTSAEWTGVTYPADLEPVRQRIRGYIARGLYPTPLWG